MDAATKRKKNKKREKRSLATFDFAEDVTEAIGKLAEALHCTRTYAVETAVREMAERRGVK